jgi:serine protease
MTWHAARAQQPGQRDYVPGELIVGFKSTDDLDKAANALKEAERSGGISTRGASSSSVRIERLSETTAKLSLDFRTRANRKLSGTGELDALQEYARQLSGRPDVEYAHPNWIMRLHRERVKDPVYLESLPPNLRVRTMSNLPSEPNDPVFRNSLNWHYLAPPIGMNALGAWSLAKGERATVVAVLDTGLLLDHPDIKGSGNVLPGYDFISDPTRKGGGKPGRDPDPTDTGDQCGTNAPTWHGTHVAGIIGAAATNNGVGIAGVNWTTSVLPVRVLGRCGGTIEDVAAAIRWAAGLDVPGVPKNDKKADVINLSLGIGVACTQENVGVLIQALNAARRAGTSVVVAAGNESVDIRDESPSGCTGVISVAASDQQGFLAPYSNFGNVTIMAPGGDLKQFDDENRPYGVWSLVSPSSKNPSGVAAYEGTSMATPHVSAAIALTLANKPNLKGKPDEIEKLLTRSLAPLPEHACSKPCGPGLLDAKRMLEPEVLTSKK